MKQYGIQNPLDNAGTSMSGAARSMSRSQTPQHLLRDDDDFGDTLLKAAATGLGIHQHIKEHTHNKAVGNHLKDFESKGLDYMPELESMSGDDMRAFLEAKSAFTQMSTQSEQHKRQVMQTTNEKITQLQESAAQLAPVLRLAVQENDASTAFDMIEQAHDLIPDGWEIQIDRENPRYRMKNTHTGQYNPWVEFDDHNTMAQTLSENAFQMVSSKSELAKSYANMSMQIKAQNMEASLKPMLIKFDNGKEGLFYNFVNDITGKPMPMVRVSGSDEYISPEQAREHLGEFQTFDNVEAIEEARLSGKKRDLGMRQEVAKTKKMEAEANEARIVAEAAIKSGGMKGETLGSLEKDIRAYMNAYGKDAAEALDMIRADKLNKELLSQMESYSQFLLKEDLVEEGSAEYQERMNQKRDSLIRGGATVLDRTQRGGPGVGGKTPTRESLLAEVQELMKQPGMTKEKAKKTMQERYPNLKF